MIWPSLLFSFFFFNDTATTEIYTLSLHDALPICRLEKEGDVGEALRQFGAQHLHVFGSGLVPFGLERNQDLDRKSTRLNSSHLGISYAVFCLKKKKRSIRPYRLYSDVCRAVGVEC